MAENRSIFSFKTFALAHGNPGLKITTEACLFGAWAQQFVEGNVLDIGTGCGLLAAMIRQKHPEVDISAVEVQSDVAELARENCRDMQIQVLQTNIQAHVGIYDFIISNPPFFSNHLPNETKSKHISLHDDLLSPADLAKSIAKLLHNSGTFAVLYPPLGLQQFEIEANTLGLFIHRILHIKHSPTHSILRSMAIGSFDKRGLQEEEIVIKDSANTYSHAFRDLLKPYYIIFE